MGDGKYFANVINFTKCVVVDLSKMVGGINGGEVDMGYLREKVAEAKTKPT